MYHSDRFMKSHRQDIALITLFLFIATFAMLSSPSAASTSQQLVDIGNAFTDAHRYQEAIDAYNKALELDPNNANAWRGKGLALKNLERFQEAIDAFNKATDIDPDYLDAWMNKGWTLDSSEKKQEAVEVFQLVINISDRLIATDPAGNIWKNKGDNPWHYKGGALSSLGDNEKSLIAFDKATSITPDNPYSWNGKGQSLFALGKFQEAIDAYDRAIQIKSNDAGFWQNKGNALKALGNFQESNRAFDKAYEITTTLYSPASNEGDGLIYLAISGLITLLALGAIFFFENRSKNKYKFIDDLKINHLTGYYIFLISQLIIGAIWGILSFSVIFRELPILFDLGKFYFIIPIFFLCISSFILLAGFFISRPTAILNRFHFFVSLLMGIISVFVKVINPGDSMPVFIPVLFLLSSILSLWYNKAYLLKSENNQTTISKIDFENIVPTIDVKRGYTVLPNNDIKFGIRVKNETSYTITDMDTILDYNEDLFEIKDSKIQRIGNIAPEGVRTITYILKPLACIHNEQINALITYKDHTGKKQTLHMRSKEMHCIIPHLKEKPMSEYEYTQHANIGESVQEGIIFKGISVEEMSKFMAVKCKNMLYKVAEYDIEGKKIIYLSGEAIGEKAYYLLTVVIQEYNGLTQVALRAYSDKKYGLNGFMNEMADNIRHLVGSVQNAKEIGIIENTQVINIIDSVVQRTNFEMGKGSTRMNIGESVCSEQK